MQVNTPTDRFLGRCEKCVRPVGVEEPNHSGDYFMVRCPECGGGIQLERLYGTLNAEPCDGLCMGAVGKLCLCSCGGRNHGGLFFETGEALASAVEAYRQRTENRVRAASERRERREAQKAADSAEVDRQYREANAEVLARIEAYTGSNDFMLDIQAKARTRQLSDRQLEAADRVIARDAAWAAQRQAEAANGKPVPEGTQIVEGVVLSTRVDEGRFGTTVKMLVKGDGWKVWGTVPSSLSLPLKGSKVRFTATVERSKDDETFGFFKRPRKAEVLDEGLVAA